MFDMSDSKSLSYGIKENMTEKDWVDFFFYTFLGELSIAFVNYRAYHGITQEQLASILGVSVRRIRNLEIGNTNIDVKTLASYYARLSVTDVRRHPRVSDH